MKPTPITASGERTSMPSHVPTQIIAGGEQRAAAAMRRRRRASTSVCVRQPTSRPVPSRIAIDSSDAGQLGEEVAEQVRRARRRQRAEAVDHALREVGGDRRRRAHHPEGERLDEDAADEVLAVVAAVDVDGAAEHVGEQQHEHQRLHRDVEQLLGDLADVLDVAAGEHERVGHQRAQAGRASHGWRRRGRRLRRAGSGWRSCGTPRRSAVRGR